MDMPHHRHGPPWNSPVASSQTIHVGGASIQIDFAPGDLDVPKSDVIEWIETAARAVSKYYGKFPVARDRVLVVPIADESGVLTGTTWGDVDGFPAFTRMRLGQHTTEQTLTDDWTMTHEFVHTALPSLSPDHHWLEEGLATYVEPIARAQIGTLSAEQVWGGMVRDMGKGEPQPGAGWLGSDAYLGEYVLGRRAILPDGRCVDSREDPEIKKGCRMRCAGSSPPADRLPMTGPSPRCWMRAIGPLARLFWLISTRKWGTRRTPRSI